MATTDENAKLARTLVRLSRIFGWGGLGVLLLVMPVSLVLTHDGIVAMVVAGIGLISAFVGAILGQVGRGMQGRVI